ncbi:MAG: alkene reductase [Chryseolinea sp.]
MKINNKLFQSVSKHGIEFANRIAMAPMTRSRAIGHIPNKLIAEYYAQRATAGLIITEGTSPSVDGLGYARTPGIYSKEQIEQWRLVTDAVRGNNGRIFVQLMHVGRISHGSNKPAGGRTVAPSGIMATGEMWTDTLGMQPHTAPAELSNADVKQTIQDFIKASKNAIASGFNGVEFHGANGYLFEQFLNPNTNTRTDEYGGSIENRMRFLIEAVEGTVKAIGKEKVGVRISPHGTFNDMLPYNEVFKTYTLLAAELSKLDILYLHIAFASRVKQMDSTLLPDIRKNFKNILMLNGGYNAESAAHSLDHEGADMISFGSTFISNPDLPHRLQYDLELSSANPQTFYTPGEAGLTDYPTAQPVMR